MPTTLQPASPAVRKRFCGLGNHHLREPARTISDARMLTFAKRMNTEMRSTTLICGTCYDALFKIYRVKLQHWRELQKDKNRKAGNTNSISDVSNSQPLATTSSSSAVVSPNDSTTSYLSLTTSYLPSNSTNAKRKREGEPQSGSSSEPQPQLRTSSSDDDESGLSLNAVNGTRLPNVQPIPKRRQFVHLNKDIMDIYLSGTTGG